ncbi:hypothetical protein ACFQZS_14115 [Mucilaginibacter calamicampi]|uniref:Metal binding domain of Ada n=1 Tax=Mucilaginibacter calamicampi TaxID=1302352 RepID=A0ABW2YYX4_9SPHI
MRKYLLMLVAVLTVAISQPSFAQTKSKKTTKKQVQKEVTVYITRTGAKYHSEYCSYLRRSSIPIGKRDAMSQGFDACSRCNP